MANALRKIQARVKKLRKRYPKKKYSSLMKQAGKEYSSGKLKTRKKSAPKKAVRKKRTVRRKVGAVRKRKAVVRKRRVVRRSKPTVVRRRTVVVYKTRKRRRSVSGVGASMKKLMPVLAIAGVGVAAYLLLKPKNIPPIVQTANPTRNSTASDIMQYVMAAGMTASAVANLVKTINSSNDAQVQKIYDNVRNNRDPYANVAGAGLNSVRTMM